MFQEFATAHPASISRSMPVTADARSDSRNSMPSPISFGWGMAHIRINNREFARHGLADVAQSPDELRAAIERALANPRQPDRSAAERPTAASVVLDVASSSA